MAGERKRNKKGEEKREFAAQWSGYLGVRDVRREAKCEEKVGKRSSGFERRANAAKSGISGGIERPAKCDTTAWLSTHSSPYGLKLGGLAGRVRDRGGKEAVTRRRGKRTARGVVALEIPGQHGAYQHNPETRNQKPETSASAPQQALLFRSDIPKAAFICDEGSPHTTEVVGLGGPRRTLQAANDAADRADRSGHGAARRAQRWTQGKAIPLEKSTDMQK
ncbi:hypothetical protein DFH06DRAFT_1296204 [Mycena polygramma]|nr:hypothetical protein DFH06DRAFT_1296204 [Mycena polygramma]